MHKSYPLFKVHVDVEDTLRCIRTALESGYINEGEQVTQFTEGLRTRLHTENLIVVNSCTSALTLALKLSDVRHGDIVISTPMTCVATNTPIINVGAKIVWADIDPSTGCIDVESVTRLLKSHGCVKAVIGVDWAGMPIDARSLSQTCHEHGAMLIQDAAQAFGASIGTSPVHSHSDFTCYSLQAIKHLTTGDGGILVCDDKQHFKRVKPMKWFGIDRDLAKDSKGNWKGQHWNFDIYEAGYKFNMNNIAAAIGLSQLSHIDTIVASHKRNGALMSTLFSDSTKIRPLCLTRDANPSYWAFTVLLDKSIDRDQVLQSLNAEGIMAGLLHVPNHHYTCFKDSFVQLSGVDEFFMRQITLPCGWWLNVNDIEHIVTRVRRTCND